MQDGDRKEAINILERYHETEYRVVGLVPVRNMKFKLYLCGHKIREAPWKAA